MLRSITHSFAACAATLMLGAIGTTANAATGSVGSQTEMIAPITLEKTQDLDFGTIAPSAINGNVTINARTGVRSGNANVTLIGTDGQRGLFTVSAEPGATINLTGENGNIFLNGPGTARMRMVRFRVNRNNGGQRRLPQEYTIPGSGTMTIGFGARLRVRANQPAGTYTGSFDLTVEYQ